MNLYHHYAVTRRYHPGYARILPPLIDLWDRRVAWRANPWTPDEVAQAIAGSVAKGSGGSGA
jgi:hypothetical protein